MHVWLYLLLRATHKPDGCFFNGSRVILQPGQLITGRKSISEKTGVNEAKVRRVLKRFKIAQQISQQISNTSSLIAILNWDRYQSSSQQPDQPAATNNKVQNKEPSKKGSIYSAPAPVAPSTSGSDRVAPDLASVARYAAELGVAPAVAAEFHAFYEALRWHTKETGEPITNWKRSLKRWVKRQEERKEKQKAEAKVDTTAPQGTTNVDTTAPQVAAMVPEDACEDDDDKDGGDEGDEVSVPDILHEAPACALVAHPSVPAVVSHQARMLSAPWLGATLNDRSSIHFPPTQIGNVCVSRVADDSPAFRGGLLVGDIILQVDGRGIANNYEFGKMLRLVTDRMSLAIHRDGQTLSKEVVFGPR